VVKGEKGEYKRGLSLRVESLHEYTKLTPKQLIEEAEEDREFGRRQLLRVVCRSPLKGNV